MLQNAQVRLSPKNGLNVYSANHGASTPIPPLAHYRFSYTFS